MSRHTTRRTTVRLPAELLRTAQRKAAGEGRTLTALIEDGLRHVVAEKPQAEKRERVMPRVSTATGGHAPGMRTFKDLEEIEDLEYIERLRRGFK
jgi:hypothetical protein